MEIGIDSFVAATIDPKTGQAIEPARHLRELLEAIALADQVRLDDERGVVDVCALRDQQTIPVIPTYTQGLSGSRFGLSRKMERCFATASLSRIT